MNSAINKKFLSGLTLLACFAFTAPALAEGEISTLPDPVKDEPLAKTSGQETAVFAGGCFWGVQAVYQHVKGVVSATSGYAGGAASTARYHLVSTGDTGHAESVKVVYDPSKISYGKLLKIYFAVAHNPTELNRQGPDTGSQYRSEVFAVDAEQRQIAESYIGQLEAARVYPGKIVTKVSLLPAFYAAESYHQDYAMRHLTDPYISRFDLPKIDHLKQQFPELYQPQ